MASVRLISQEGDSFEVTSSEIECSRLISKMAKDLLVVTTIPLHNIPSKILSIIQKFMQLSVCPSSKDWVHQFIEKHQDSINDLIMTSHFLEIDLLTDGLAEFIAEKITLCESVEEIRSSFGITNDFTSKEEAMVRDQVIWAFD